MQITRAVITAAGRGARQYPASDTVQKAMLPVVDRDGLTKPVLQIIAEEALESGIEEICVVSAPGDEAVYRDHFRDYAANLRSAFKGVEWAEEQAFASSISSNGDDLTQASEKVAAAVRALAARVPTYVTIKNVKRRWGHGQEDVFPVAQFEKLWGDLTSLPDLPCVFLAVRRLRGQQLKDAAQLDGWVTDGSRDHVESLCAFPR